MVRFCVLTVIIAAAVSSHAQTIPNPSCQVTAVPPVIRSEGITERLGDIVLNCTGAPNQQISGAFTILLNAPVTNRLSGNNPDVAVTIRTSGAPAILPVTARVQLSSQVVFDQFAFNLGPAGTAEIRITNIRADVSQSGVALRDVIAQLAFNPPGLLNFTTNRLTVGVVNRGLYATSLLTLVGSHSGSPVPDALTFDAFIQKGTRFSSARLTEGFNAAFEKRGPGMDHGVRLVLRYTGLTSDSRIFVPAAIAGSTAQQPTAAGDFGGQVSGGAYVPGSNSLLLVRVLNTDQNGAGGFPSRLPAGAATLTEMTEVPVNTGGTAIVAYEIVDENPTVVESVQIPTFLAIPRSESARSVNVNREVFFGSLSSTSTANRIPRFAPIAPETDCNITRDCQLYQPRLVVNSALLDFDTVVGMPYVRREVIFSNEGGGLMPWQARVEYRTGSGWVEVFPQSGLEPVAVGVMLVLPNLTPGVHEATLVIDAGSGGIARLPIRLNLGPRPAPTPAVTGFGNAATFTGALVPGSLATLKGSNLQGANVSVAFNGRPARLLFTGADQINLQVPAELTGASAQMVITVNGIAGAPATVNLAQANPGIFVPGILNQDYSVNSASNPARAGSFVQIYATGVLPPDGSGRVEARLHDVVMTSLPYAGPAPGIPGVQQVNLQIPEYFPTMTTQVLLCTTAGGIRSCSPPVDISVRAQ